MSIFVYLTLYKRNKEVRRMRNRTNFLGQVMKMRSHLNSGASVSFHLGCQHLCKFIGTKESIRKEFKPQRIGLGHQHGRRFIVLGHVKWKRSINWPVLCCLFLSSLKRTAYTMFVASSPPSLRLVFCSRFIFLHHGSGSGNCEAGAVIAAVRAKEDNVEENNAVAANEVPPVALGWLSTFCVLYFPSSFAPHVCIFYLGFLALPFASLSFMFYS